MIHTRRILLKWTFHVLFVTVILTGIFSPIFRQISAGLYPHRIWEAWGSRDDTESLCKRRVFYLQSDTTRTLYLGPSDLIEFAPKCQWPCLLYHDGKNKLASLNLPFYKVRTILDSINSSLMVVSIFVSRFLAWRDRHRKASDMSINVFAIVGTCQNPFMFTNRLF